MEATICLSSQVVAILFYLVQDILSDDGLNEGIVFMSLSIGLVTILTGLAIMAFGLFMFYAWLPLLYALIGFDIGLLLGRAFTGDVGTAAIVLGIAGAFILGVASYILEPYRRILLGVSGGILFGLSVATAFGIDGWLGGFFGRILGLVCGAIGGLLVPRFFDLFVIAASAVGGAVMVMTGASHIFPGVGILDRAASGVLPTLVTIMLAVAGVIWQFSNIAKWVPMLTAPGDVSDAATRNQDGAPRY
jgi:hypothetical protein